MDRFIVKKYAKDVPPEINLKSNMDRFIATIPCKSSETTVTFKIQYGQIYSIIKPKMGYRYKNLKSNMDRFIA